MWPDTCWHTTKCEFPQCLTAKCEKNLCLSKTVLVGWMSRFLFQLKFASWAFFSNDVGMCTSHPTQYINQSNHVSSAYHCSWFRGTGSQHSDSDLQTWTTDAWKRDNGSSDRQHTAAGSRRHRGTTTPNKLFNLWFNLLIPNTRQKQFADRKQTVPCSSDSSDVLCCIKDGLCLCYRASGWQQSLQSASCWMSALRTTAGITTPRRGKLELTFAHIISVQLSTCSHWNMSDCFSQKLARIC